MDADIQSLLPARGEEACSVLQFGLALAEV